MIQCGNRLPPDGHDAFLVALADDADEAGVEMQLFETQAAQFREAQAGGVGQFHHGPVAERRGRERLGGVCFEKPFDFEIGQRLGQPFPAPGQREIFGNVQRQMFFVLGETIEGAQRGDLRINALAAQAPGGVGGFAGQRTFALMLEEGGEMTEFNLFPVRELPGFGPRNKSTEQRGVGALRVLGLPAFVPQVDEKFFNKSLHAGCGWLPLLAADCNLPVAKGAGLRLQNDLPGLARLRAHNDEAQAVVGRAMVLLKRFVARCVAVVGGDDFAGAFDGKFHKVVRARHEQTLLVRNGHGDEGQVVTVGAEEFAVWAERDLRGRAGGFHRVSGPASAVLVGDDFEFAGLIDHVVPAEAILEGAALLSSERVAVEK